MPKDEFDFEDPFELNGMAFMTHEDTTNDMAETFIEEFMRMGYNPQQLLALFRNPHYLGPNMAFEKHGEPFIRALIADIFARWGKKVEWPAAAVILPSAEAGAETARESVEGAEAMSSAAAFAGASAKAGRQVPAATDPTGAPIPEYTV